VYTAHGVLVERFAVVAVGVDRADHMVRNQQRQRQRRVDAHLGEPCTEPRPADITIMVTGIVGWVSDAASNAVGASR
jgi:hypothetical protein